LEVVAANLRNPRLIVNDQNLLHCYVVRPAVGVDVGCSPCARRCHSSNAGGTPSYRQPHPARHGPLHSRPRTTKKKNSRKKIGKIGKNPKPHGLGQAYTYVVPAGGAAMARPASATP